MRGDIEREYANNFNHEVFFDWAANHNQPVFISEYNIADNRFKQVFQVNKRSMLASNKDKCVDKKEKVYVNEVGYKILKIDINNKKIDN